MTSENAENCCSRHYHLMPLPQGTSANIRIDLILPETKSLGYNIAADIT